MDMAVNQTRGYRGAAHINGFTKPGCVNVRVSLADMEYFPASQQQVADPD
jgi:hypothetical protein